MSTGAGLVGRDQLLAQLRRAAQDAAAGRGGLVLLTGEAGMKNLLRLLGVRGMATAMLGRLRAHTPAHTPAHQDGAVDRSEPQPGNIPGGTA